MNPPFTVYGKTLRLVVEDDLGEFEVANAFKLVNGAVQINMRRYANAVDDRDKQTAARPVY